MAREDFYPSDPAVLPGYAGYGSLAWKRAMLAKRLAEAGAYPKNIGEGIASAGRDIGNVLMAKSLQEDERKQAAAERGLLLGEPRPAATAALPDERRDVVRPTVAVDEQLPPTAQATSAPAAPSGFTGANDDPYRDAPVQQASATTPDAAVGVEAQSGRARLAALMLQQQQQRALTGNMGGQPLAGARSMQPNSPPGELNPATVFDPLGRQPQAGFIPYDENNPPPVPRYFNGASSEPAAMPVSQPAAPAGSTSPIQLAAAGGLPAPDTPPPASPEPTPERLAQARDYTFAPRGIPGPPLPTMPPAGNAPGTPPTTLPGVTRAPAGVIGNQAIYGEGVPAATDIQVAAHPGERPKPPPIPMPTPAMQYWQRVHAADISPEGKEYAKNQYAIHAENQKRTYELGLNEYYHLRGRYDTDLAEHEKGLREKDQKQLEQLKTRLSIADSINMDPLKKEQLQRQIVELDQKLKAGVAPKTETVQGRLVGWNQTTGKFEDITPQLTNPQLPEGAAKELKFFERMHTAASQLNAPGKHTNAVALAGYADTAKGLIPLGNLLGITNFVQSKEYKAADTLANVWLQAVLRDESGALIGTKELAEKRRFYFPIPGDGPAEIARKANLRNAEERSFLDTLGSARPIAERYIEDRRARRTSESDDTERKNNRTGQKQRVIGGHWEDVN